jgi:F-type H+-transporting ATPase subunit delta
MKGSKVAIRYARSLFGLALSTNQLEKIKMDVAFLSQTIREQRDLRVLLGSPVVKEEKKVAIFNELFNGAIAKETLDFLGLLAQKRRESMLADICDSFLKIYYNHNDIEEVTLTTAIAADDNMRQTVKTLVGKLTKSSLLFTEIVDPSLIGGFVVRLGDTQIDASVAGKLQQSKNQLLKNVYSSSI